MMPSHEDARLILQLYDLRREERMRQARDWFVKNFHVRSAEEFHTLCPPGSDANAFYRQVVTYWEMVASFVSTGVLNQELFFQSGAELLLVWTRVRPFAAEMRETMKTPIMFKNLEQVGNAYIDYWERNYPGMYIAFAARIAPPQHKSQG